MKKLTVEQMGLYELSLEESKEINGGFGWLIPLFSWGAAAYYFVSESATNPTASAKALQAGFEAGSK